LASAAADWFEHKLLADSEVVFVVASGAVTAVDLWLVDCVQGADGTASLEDELVATTSELAHSAAAQGVASDADALVVRDDLVGSTGVAVAVGV